MTRTPTVLFRLLRKLRRTTSPFLGEEKNSDVLSHRRGLGDKPYSASAPSSCTRIAAKKPSVPVVAGVARK
jgi:hypothetical protein